jgi:hypothetical protein
LVEVGEYHLAGECEFERGRSEYARGRLDRAYQAILEARGHFDNHLPTVLGAYVSALEGDVSAEEQLNERITELELAGSDWWVQLARAEVRLLLAERLIEDINPTAIPTLEQAILELEGVGDGSSRESERLLALVQAALARILHATNSGAAARVNMLASEAHSYFAQWPGSYGVRLAELDLLISPSPL